MQAAAELSLEIRAAMSGGAPVSLPFSTVSSWTDDFNPAKEIGRGSFGLVFEGLVVLEGQKGLRVAVKKVNAEGIVASLVLEGREKGPKTFIQAIQREINVLSAFHHPNIIRLIGYCLPPTQELRASEQKMTELCLVYELASLGDLSSVLRDDEKASQLSWQNRLDVAVGVAKGLCCMHNPIAGSPAFHRDMKSANIALMADLTPKIIDCGLSKYVPDAGVVGMSNSSSMGTRFGTPGYICRYYSDRPAMPYDAKCEIFSFGVVLLELLTGKLQNYTNEAGEWVLLQEEEVLPADARAGDWPEECKKEFLQLAGECTASYKNRISAMLSVMRYLVVLRNKYVKHSTLEASLLAQTHLLIAQVAALQLQNDVRDSKKVELTYKCEICSDEILASKGVLCTNTDHPHFICDASHDNCFSDMVSSQASDQGNFENNGRRIVCPLCKALVPKIITPFDLSVVAKHADETALAAFISAGNSLERCQGLALLEKQQLQHADEIQKLKESHMGDKGERMKAATQRHRQRIIDNILSCKCPHCDLAIFDFAGCFAVEHTSDERGLRTGCGQYFCGWCLAKFGGHDACHDHVKHSCRSNPNPGDYYGKFPEEFNTVHGQRRRGLVLKYLEDNIGDAEEREEVKRALEVDLSDLGINL